MKTRIVQTDFWKKMVKMKAPKDVRLLYHYLFTNEHIGMTGIYELPDEYIMTEIGITEEEIAIAKEWLSKNNKVLFYEGWVKVVTAEEHNNYKNGEKNIIAYRKELKDIPLEVLNVFGQGNLDSIDNSTEANIHSSNDTTIEGEPWNGTIDTSIYSSYNTKTQNKKSQKGVVKGEIAPPESFMVYLTSLPKNDLAEFVTNFNATPSQVKAKANSLFNWCKSKGRESDYVDFKALLLNVLENDFGERKPVKKYQQILPPFERVPESFLQKIREKNKKIFRKETLTA